MRAPRARFWLIAWACATSACAADVVLQGDPSELSGDFQIRLIAANPATGAAARTNVSGIVKDGPEPNPVLWHVTGEAGACRLLEPEAPFCEQPCGSRGVCTGDDTCTPHPKPKAVGLVSVRGLDKPVQMEPISGNYMPVGTRLAYPPCRQGDAIELRAQGGEYPAFTREARCIAPLQFETSPRLEPGRDLTLQWSPSDKPELARIQLKLDISHHGGAKGKIECESPDSAELTIAAELVDRLVELGVAGFPTVLLTRVSQSDHKQEPRGVTLTVLESVERAVEVPGVISCTGPGQCPDGRQCASNLTCQAD